MGPSCSRGGLNWMLGKDLFTEGVAKLWNRLPRKVVEMFEKCVGVVPRDVA